MRMHNSVQKQRRAYHKAHGKNLHSEATEFEDKGEMDNFQDLQLGSLTPVVSFENDSYWFSSDHLSTGHGPNFHALTFCLAQLMRAP